MAPRRRLSSPHQAVDHTSTKYRPCAASSSIRRAPTSGLLSASIDLGKGAANVGRHPARIAADVDQAAAIEQSHDLIGTVTDELLNVDPLRPGRSVRTPHTTRKLRSLRRPAVRPHR